MMEILGMLFMLVALIAFIFGGIWFLVESFRESIWWGLGVLFIPMAEIVFLIVHWRVASKPFFIQMVGVGVIFASALIPEIGMRLGI